MTQRNGRIAWPTASGAPPEELQAMLQVAQEEHGNAAEVARLAAKLGPGFATPSAAPQATSGVGAAGSSANALLGTIAKFATLGVGILLSSAALWLGSARTPEGSRTRGIPTAARQADVEIGGASARIQSAGDQSSSSSPAVLEPSASATAAASAQPAPADLDHAAEPRAAAPKRASKSGALEGTGELSAQGALKAEAALLQRGKTALQRDARLAWQATETHKRLFPNGLLVEEREALAVQTLVQLGKLELARAQIARFERDFPRSVHISGLRTLVEQAGSSATP